MAVIATPHRSPTPSPRPSHIPSRLHRCVHRLTCTAAARKQSSSSSPPRGMSTSAGSQSFEQEVEAFNNKSLETHREEHAAARRAQQGAKHFRAAGYVRKRKYSLRSSIQRDQQGGDEESGDGKGDDREGERIKEGPFLSTPPLHPEVTDRHLYTTRTVAYHVNPLKWFRSKTTLGNSPSSLVYLWDTRTSGDPTVNLVF